MISPYSFDRRTNLEVSIDTSFDITKQHRGRRQPCKMRIIYERNFVPLLCQSLSSSQILDKNNWNLTWTRLSGNQVYLRSFLGSQIVFCLFKLAFAAGPIYWIAKCEMMSPWSLKVGTTKKYMFRDSEKEFCRARCTGSSLWAESSYYRYRNMW